MEEKNLSNLTLDDLVFENRNKSYGSYELRVKYGVYVVKAFAISLSVFLLIAFTPDILDWIDAKWGSPAVEIVADDFEQEVFEDISIDKDIPPPPPPVEIPPLKLETVKFLPPVITEKEIIEPPIAKQKDLDTASNIGAKDQAGEKGEERMEAATGNGNGVAVEDNKEYSYVGEWPQFPGGPAELNKFLSKNIIYPRDAEKKGLSGKVMVSFTVEKTGEIVNVKILKGISESLDNEAMRVVKKMPNWKPGKNNGVPVRVKYKVDINYTIPD